MCNCARALQQLVCGAQDDERRLVSRDMNGTHEGGPLRKQNSMNLPAPDSSGFPAHHPP